MMMIGNSISDKRTTFDHLDDDMVDRHMGCRFALLEELQRVSPYPCDSPQFLAVFESFRFACVPKLSSWKEVVKTNNEIDKLKIMCDDSDVTLFKIPRLVNNVEGYVAMLFRKHVRESWEGKMR